MEAGTPREITDDIRLLCSTVSPGNEPEYLDVSPIEDARDLDCFPVVEKHVSACGGSICYGWRIWELPWTFVEAEFHAVWCSPDSKLIDITPAPRGARRILFVPDPARQYDGRQVNNVRRALSEDPAVQAFFNSADQEFEFLNRGSRADEYSLRLTPAEAGELKEIRARRAAALANLVRTIPDPGRNDPCPCGSKKKYKKCCGARSG